MQAVSLTVKSFNCCFWIEIFGRRQHLDQHTWSKAFFRDYTNSTINKLRHHHRLHLSLEMNIRTNVLLFYCFIFVFSMQETNYAAENVR